MAYIGKSPTGTGVRSRYYFTATGGETSLSGASDSGATLSFSDGNYVDVSLNGVALVAGTDYNTTTANTIGGLAALSASDIVEILVYDIFTVADTVPASSGGTFNGGVTINGNLTVTGSGAGAAGVVSASSSGTAISIDSSNRVTMPAQPAFQARPASTQNNIAINANVDIVFGTEVFDVGANFASNTFIAPVAGKYFLSTSIRLGLVDSAADYYLCTIVTSNRNYQFIFDPDFGQDANYWVMSINHIADMDASDTAKVQVYQSAGTQQTDIATESIFSGALIS